MTSSQTFNQTVQANKRVAEHVRALLARANYRVDRLDQSHNDFIGFTFEAKHAGWTYLVTVETVAPVDDRGNDAVMSGVNA